MINKAKALFFFRGEKGMKKWKEYLPYVIILVLILLIKTYVITTIRVNGNSMNNTLLNGDIMLLDKVEYRFHDVNRFDIVVVKRDKDKLIKRVIGLPGEKVAYLDNVLYIDGKEVKDPYNRYNRGDFEVTLKKNEYFVMGDNRSDSLDSFYFGPIKEKQIMGKAIFTIFPFSRFGKAK